MENSIHRHGARSSEWSVAAGLEAIGPLPAQDWRSGIPTERHQERRGARPKTSIDEGIALFLAHLRTDAKASDNTVRHYAHDLEMFHRYLLRCRPRIDFLGDIRPVTILGFVRYMTEVRGNTGQSARRRLAALRRLFAYLRLEQRLSHDPTEALAVKAKPIGRPVTLDIDQCQRLLEAAKTTSFPLRDHAIFYLFLTTGCTLSELIHLRPEDVQLDTGFISFVGRSEAWRTIRLSPGCLESLRRYAEERPKAPASARSFFLNRRGEPITKGAVYHSFRIALKASGNSQEGITIHSLRHTCFALLWQAGVSIQILRRFAGHKSIASTRIYKTIGPRPASPKPWDWVHPLDEWESDGECERGSECECECECECESEHEAECEHEAEHE